MQDINYTHCPLCHSGHFFGFIKVKDHSVTGREFNISKCPICSLLFTNPVPDTKSITRYYKSPTYISHTNNANNLINFLYKAVRKYTLKKKVNLIKNFSGNKLLDIGCGTGLFLEQSFKAGYEIFGIENDPTALNNQPHVISNQVFKSIKEVSLTPKFDIITMWHVLEHLHDLKEQFLHITDHLRPDGHIIVAVPNPESWDRKHYEEYWAAWDVPRHLYHFNKNNIKTLFKEYNISLIAIRPMLWDAFYVSMLSEKYQGNSLFKQITNGIKNGIISNFKGRNNNSSSLIYIGRKNA